MGCGLSFAAKARCSVNHARLASQKRRHPDAPQLHGRRGRLPLHEPIAGGDPSLPVTFQIPGPLRSFTGGRSCIELPASPATLREALELLWDTWPGVRDRIV